MELKGERRLPVGREEAWAALNDPQRLRAAIPGCESMERTGEGEYAAVVASAIGPVRARFEGTLRVADAEPPERYTIHFEGRGGPAGFAKGSAQVELVEDGTGTLLRYTSNARVGGRIAQVGQRLVDAAAAKVADDFFAAFRAQLAAEQGAAAARGEPAPAEAPAPGPRRRERSRGPMWVGIAVVAIAVAMALWLS